MPKFSTIVTFGLSITWLEGKDAKTLGLVVKQLEKTWNRSFSIDPKMGTLVHGAMLEELRAYLQGLKNNKQLHSFAIFSADERDERVTLELVFPNGRQAKVRLEQEEEEAVTTTTPETEHAKA